MSSPAVAQQGAPETAPVAEQPQQPQLTREQLILKIREAQETQFIANDRAQRLAIARRGYRVEVQVPALDKNGDDTGFTKPKSVLCFLDPSVEPSDAELRAMVPLPQDRWNYAWENKDKGTHGVVATNQHGLVSIGKQHGRHNKHMTKRNQAIKSASMRIFQKLFSELEITQREQVTAKGEKYVGVPEADVEKLAVRATRMAMREIYRSKKAVTRHLRRQQEANRRANTGQLAGNQVNSYVHKEGQYGR